METKLFPHPAAKAALDKLFPSSPKTITVTTAAGIMRRLYASTLCPDKVPGSSPATPSPKGGE